MKLVIDTNILISALIKDSVTRKIILESNLDLCFPLPSFYELNKYRQLVLEKSKISERDYNIILLSLTRKIRVIHFPIISPYVKQAFNIIGHIDPDDVLFIATALAFKCPIWSDDAHFKKQRKVKILTTSEILSLK